MMKNQATYRRLGNKEGISDGGKYVFRIKLVTQVENVSRGVAG